MAVSSLSTYKAFRTIGTGDDAPSDNAITDALAVVNSYISRVTGREWVSATAYVQDISGTGASFVYVSNRPITAVAYVRIYSSKTAYTELNSDEYRYDSTSGRFERLSNDFSQSSGYDSVPSFPEGFNNVQISYTAGGTVPEELELYCHKMVDEILGLTGWRSPEEGQTYVYKPNLEKWYEMISQFRDGRTYVG